MRIARDMHDVVAHSLAVVIAQADGARYAAAADPAVATEALGTISTTARAALADVRLLLDAAAPQPGRRSAADARRPRGALRAGARLRGRSAGRRRSRAGGGAPRGGAARGLPDPAGGAHQRPPPRRRRPGRGAPRVASPTASSSRCATACDPAPRPAVRPRHHRHARARAARGRIADADGDDGEFVVRATLPIGAPAVSAPIRVVLVDDQALFRAGIRMLIDSQPDLEVVGEAADGREAIDVVRAARPDVVLMDIRMPVHGRPRGDGRAAARRRPAPHRDAHDVRPRRGRGARDPAGGERVPAEGRRPRVPARGDPHGAFRIGRDRGIRHSRSVRALRGCRAPAGSAPPTAI